MTAKAVGYTRRNLEPGYRLEYKPRSQHAERWKEVQDSLSRALAEMEKSEPNEHYINFYLRDADEKQKKAKGSFFDFLKFFVFGTR